jgi:hypothetical protein
MAVLTPGAIVVPIKWRYGGRSGFVETFVANGKNELKRPGDFV